PTPPLPALTGLLADGEAALAKVLLREGVGAQAAGKVTEDGGAGGLRRQLLFRRRVAVQRRVGIVGRQEVGFLRLGHTGAHRGASGGIRAARQAARAVRLERLV